MKFRLSDIESEKDIAKLLRKKIKKQKQKQEYTHIPDEDIPYHKSDLSKFVDYSYDVDDDANE